MATKEDLTAYEKFFSSADTDKSGCLSPRELQAALKKCGADDKIVAEIFVDLDKDGDKKITKAEYMSAMNKMRPSQVDEMKLRRAFKELDADGSGKIDAKELKMVLEKCGKKVSDNAIQDIIKKVDKDGDGQINCEEFIKAFLGK